MAKSSKKGIVEGGGPGYLCRWMDELDGVRDGWGFRDERELDAGKYDHVVRGDFGKLHSRGKCNEFEEYLGRCLKLHCTGDDGFLHSSISLAMENQLFGSFLQVLPPRQL